MPRDILSEYGPDSPNPQASKMSGSGQVTCKPLPYDPPKGPTAHMQESPGLHGTNHGNCGTQGKR
jgi:hypothetical protein